MRHLDRSRRCVRRGTRTASDGRGGARPTVAVHYRRAYPRDVSVRHTGDRGRNDRGRDTTHSPGVGCRLDIVAARVITGVLPRVGVSRSYAVVRALFPERATIRRILYRVANRDLSNDVAGYK